MTIWTRQPQRPVRLSPYWLSRGLCLFTMPALYGRFNSALPLSYPAVSADLSPLSVVHKPSRFGPVTCVFNPSTNPTRINYESSMKPFNGSSNYTLMFLGAQEARAQRYIGFCLHDESTGNFTSAQLSFNANKGSGTTSGQIAFWEYNGGFNVACDTATNQVDGEIAMYFARRKGINPSIWKNGKDITTSVTTGATTVTTWPDKWSLGGSTGMANYTVFGGAFRTALSDAEIIQLSKNPMQVFAEYDEHDDFGIVVSAGAATLGKANYADLANISHFNGAAKATIASANGLTTGS